MARTLPFVVQPRLAPVIERVGTDTAGYIEIERRGYLSVAEKSIVQGGMSGATYLRDAMSTIKQVGIATKKDTNDVFADLSTGQLPEYLEDYSSDIAGALGAMEMHENRLKMVAVTALLMSRVDMEWGVEDTSALHPDLVDAIYQLYSDEEKRCVEALEGVLEEPGEEQADAEGKE